MPEKFAKITKLRLDLHKDSWVVIDGQVYDWKEAKLDSKPTKAEDVKGLDSLGPYVEPRKFDNFNILVEHNTREDLWLLIDGKIYDVSGFKHPGGIETLVNNAGIDATPMFEDIQHSNKADKLMLDFYLGDLMLEDDEIEEQSKLNVKESER
jgi:cytochrome b involved in lipid metabolism